MGRQVLSPHAPLAIYGDLLAIPLQAGIHRAEINGVVLPALAREVRLPHSLRQLQERGEPVPGAAP